MKKLTLIFASIEACSWRRDGNINFPPPSRIVAGVVRLFAIVGFLFSLTACSNPERVAQKLIKDYLKENLKDPSSYSPAEFGHLDSLYTTFDSQVFEDSFRHSKGEYDVAMFEDDFKASGLALEKMKQIQVEWEKAEKEFHPQFCGWKMSHKYRAKNGFGALDISTDVFYFDKELTKVVDVEDNN